MLGGEFRGSFVEFFLAFLVIFFLKNGNFILMRFIFSLLISNCRSFRASVISKLNPLNHSLICSYSHCSHDSLSNDLRI